MTKGVHHVPEHLSTMSPVYTLWEREGPAAKPWEGEGR